MKEIINTVVQILKQPTTYVGIATILAGFGVISPETRQLVLDNSPLIAAQTEIVVAAVVAIAGSVITVKNAVTAWKSK